MNIFVGVIVSFSIFNALLRFFAICKNEYPKEVKISLRFAMISFVIEVIIAITGIILIDRNGG